MENIISPVIISTVIALITYIYLKWNIKKDKKKKEKKINLGMVMMVWVGSYILASYYLDSLEITQTPLKNSVPLQPTKTLLGRGISPTLPTTLFRIK